MNCKVWQKRCVLSALQFYSIDLDTFTRIVGYLSQFDGEKAWHPALTKFHTLQMRKISCRYVPKTTRNISWQSLISTRACVRACVRMCARARARACVCVCVCVCVFRSKHTTGSNTWRLSFKQGKQCAKVSGTAMYSRQIGRQLFLRGDDQKVWPNLPCNDADSLQVVRVQDFS